MGKGVGYPEWEKIMDWLVEREAERPHPNEGRPHPNERRPNPNERRPHPNERRLDFTSGGKGKSWSRG